MFKRSTAARTKTMTIKLKTVKTVDLNLNSDAAQIFFKSFKDE